MESKRTINKYIFTQIMGNCGGLDWHIITEPCPKCGGLDAFDDAHDHPPDYCSDNSPRALLNEVVVKIVSTCNFATLIATAFSIYPTDTAEKIARACVQAHKSIDRGV
jgi:hypothetical protein